jgi:hypothetical protein
MSAIFWGFGKLIILLIVIRVVGYYIARIVSNFRNMR